MLNWSGLRDFLEVAETGSLSAAAKNLKVSQPTLGRRINALEDQMKSELFVRTPQGLQLTETGEHILGYSKRMQDEAFAVERIATGRDKVLSGTVIISIVDGMATHWLLNELDNFYKQYPDITLVIQAEQTTADLLRREADIAVRMFEPTQMDLISKKGGSVRLGLYASKDYLAKFGTPKTIDDLKTHNFLKHSNIHEASKDTLLEDLSKRFKRIPVISSNMTIILSAISNGLGMGIHANIVAKDDPNLVNILPDEVSHTLDFWLVTHSELRRSARIRAVYDFLSQLAEKNRDRY